MRVVPVVEGEGEVKAVPVLLRRMIEIAGGFEQLEISRPIRVKRNQLLKQEGFAAALRLARIQNSGVVLILFDSDGECPVNIRDTLEGWASAEASDMNCQIVIAHHEYEAWFLSSIHSLRAHPTVRDEAMVHPDPESRQGAKEQLSVRMHAGTSYSPTAHQAAFSQALDMAAAYNQCRSFRKLAAAFGEILRLGGVDQVNWPPHDWSHPASSS